MAAHVAGEEPDGVGFRRDGRVTVSTLARAKGNEAWKVYVLGFQYAAPGGPTADEVRRRNEAFVALTRTRLWCVVTGVGHAAPAFAEPRRAAEQQPELCFPAFNQRQLHRPLDDEEGTDEPEASPEDCQPTLFDGVV